MKAVILAGRLVTRLSEETTIRPKSMVEIGACCSMAYNENLFPSWNK